MRISTAGDKSEWRATTTLLREDTSPSNENTDRGRCLVVSPEGKALTETAGDVVLSFLLFRLDEKLVGYAVFDQVAQIHVCREI